MVEILTTKLYQKEMDSDSESDLDLFEDTFSSDSEEENLLDDVVRT